jgi:hypothetical protein
VAITRNFTSGAPPVIDRVASSAPTVLVTFGVALGDLIVVPIVFEDGAITVTSVTDTAGNTYVQAGAYARDANSPSTSCAFYCASAKASSASTNTITVHLSSSTTVGAAVQSVTSPNVTWALDKTTGTSGTSGGISSGSVTTTSANEYVVASAYGDGASTQASGAITPQYTHTPLGGLSFEATGDAILTSTGSIAGTFTYGGGNFSAFIATFAATASASGPFAAPKDPVLFSTPF